jgi:hypothetical protein
VFGHIMACRAAIEKSFEDAGLGCLASTQVDSLFAGTIMQQYVGEKLFGQYGTEEEEGSDVGMEEGLGGMWEFQEGNLGYYFTAGAPVSIGEYLHRKEGDLPILGSGDVP